MTSITEQIDDLQKSVEAITQFLKTIPNAIGTLSNKVDTANATLAKIGDITAPPQQDLSAITDSLNEIRKILAPAKEQKIKGELQ